MATNKGKSWSQDEMDTLLSELREKKTDKEIAEAHGRTVNAIKFKALGYACDQVLKSGKTKEEVLEDLGLSETELQKELDKRTMPRPVANVVANITEKKPIVVVKKPVDDLSEIMATVNRLQSLVQRYITKVSTK
jgi:poly(A) polymerase Pap1